MKRELIGTALIIAVAVCAMPVVKNLTERDTGPPETAVPTAIQEPTPEPEPMPEDEVIHILTNEADEILLAKIMKAEAGVDWPDAMVMLIGEVVLNRVNDPAYPDTVRGVLYQSDPVQYEPVHLSTWETMDTDAHYLALARRLLEGERVLGNERVVYQALFEQGEKTILSYYDEVLGSTTYFCAKSGDE